MGQPELSGRRRYLVLAICCISLFIVGIDATIVNVALPSIQRDLHAPVSGLQWIVDAYTLVLASLLMLSGSTGDRAGRRRTFQTGLECSRSDRCSAAWHLRRGDLAHQPAPWRRGRRRRARGRHRRAGSGPSRAGRGRAWRSMEPGFRRGGSRRTAGRHGQPERRHRPPRAGARRLRDGRSGQGRRAGAQAAAQAGRPPAALGGPDQAVDRLAQPHRNRVHGVRARRPGIHQPAGRRADVHQRAHGRLPPAAVFRKLGISSRVELARISTRTGPARIAARTGPADMAAGQDHDRKAGCLIPLRC